MWLAFLVNKSGDSKCKNEEFWSTQNSNWGDQGIISRAKIGMWFSGSDDLVTGNLMNCTFCGQIEQKGKNMFSL